MPRRERRHTLSKSRFVAGTQCHKLLWWTVHEPDAPERQPDKVLQDRFDQGVHVGRRARERFPGGVLIDLPHGDPGRVAATREAIVAGAPAVFEATFVEDGVFVAVDVLLKAGDAWTLIEVKSSTKAKPEHVPDAAVQTYVARRAGLAVPRVEVMHLNGAFRHPDAGDLFARTDVTAEVEALLPQVPRLIAEQVAALDGPLPDVPVGLHCWDPRVCPFFDRCWPPDRDHIRRLHGAWKIQTISRMEGGVHSIHDLPPGERLTFTQARQRRAVVEDRMIVEPVLGRALEPFARDRLGFLDFETVSRAVPVWDGLGPWQPTVVQFSYHERQPDGRFTHAAYLAEGPHDPRAELVDRMLEATAGAEPIVMYSSFERTRIKELASQVPARAPELLALADRLIDLLPVVRNHVYHPEFRGSFSLKYILTPLVPDLTYDDLAIVDGQVASVEIARLLFVAHLVEDRDQLRRDLLAYCERDTWAMVRLLERLRELAGVAER